MIKRIQTYQELLDEKERLKSVLKIQAEVIRQDVHAIGEELEPIRSAIAFAGKLFTRDRNNLFLAAGTNTLIDIAVKKLFLSKAGWLTRLVVPYFVKNYSSHVDGKGIINKLFSWIGKKRHANGQEKVHDDIDLEED
jgi:hypothetical protein